MHHQIALMYLWYLLELPEIWARGRVQLHPKIALMKIWYLQVLPETWARGRVRSHRKIALTRTWYLQKLPEVWAQGHVRKHQWNHPARAGEPTKKWRAVGGLSNRPSLFMAQ